MELVGILQCHKSPPSLTIPDEINVVHVLYPTSWRSTLILFFQVFMWVSSGHFLSGFTTRALYAFQLSVTYVLHVLPLPIFLILSLVWYLTSVTKYENPHDKGYPVFSLILPLKPKYTAQRPILRCSLSMFFPHCDKPSLHGLNQRDKTAASIIHGRRPI